jgi:hypothetical protein
MASIENLCAELMELPLDMKVKPYHLKVYGSELAIETDCMVVACGQLNRMRKGYLTIAGLIEEVGKMEDRNKECAIGLLRQAYKLCKEASK